MDELASLRRTVLEAEFRSFRGRWPGMPGFEALTRDVIPHSLKLALTMNGTINFWGHKLPPAQRGHAAHASESVVLIRGGQVANDLQVGVRVTRGRPQWTRELFAAYSSLLTSGKSVSPGHYPHAAEDILLALQCFAMPPQFGAATAPRRECAGTTAGKRTGTSSGAAILPDGLRARAAVWSSISPWVEGMLLHHGMEAVTTVDYNTPDIADDVGVNVSTLGQEALAGVYADSGGKGYFDLIISFSGLEHDGLGRYGDPINPDGDLAAMSEIRSMLRAGGLVLLGIPTARHDNVVYPGHREYGPVRLPKMIAGFQMLGRVWDGKVVHGGLEAAEMPPLLYAGKGAVTGAHGKNATDDRWQHEQVLVLQKKQ